MASGHERERAIGQTEKKAISRSPATFWGGLSWVRFGLGKEGGFERKEISVNIYNNE